MARQFSENLSLLRREKNLSQRKAAADLGVSQALLSHYENAVREPGLDFVGRACDYYGVSSDFMLGRTELRSRPLPSGSLPASADALSFASEVLRLAGEDSSAARYLHAAIYRLLRRFASGRFTIPQQSVGPLCDIEMRLAELSMPDSPRRDASPAMSYAMDAEERMKKLI